MACDIIRLDQERMVRYKSSWDTYLLIEVTWEFYVVNKYLLYERRWGGLLSSYPGLTILVIDFYSEMVVRRYLLRSFASGCCPSHWDFPSSGSLFLAWTFATHSIVTPCPLNLAFLNTYYVITPPKILFLPRKQVQTLQYGPPRPGGYVSLHIFFSCYYLPCPQAPRL